MEMIERAASPADGVSQSHGGAAVQSRRASAAFFAFLGVLQVGWLVGLLLLCLHALA